MREEHTVVQARCGFGSLQTRLDCRPLRSGFGPHQGDDWHAEISRPYFLMKSYRGEGPLRLKAPENDQRVERDGLWVSRANKLPRHQPTPTWIVDTGQIALHDAIQGETIGCALAGAFSLALQGPATLTIVRHGVAVETKVVEAGGAGARAIAWADGLHFDLSGFRVVENEAYEELKRKVRRLWSDMADHLIVNQQLPPVHPPVDPSQKARETPLGLLNVVVDSVTGDITRRAAEKLRERMVERLQKALWYHRD